MIVSRKMDNVTMVIVALVALNLIGSSSTSPLPQRLNHSSLAFIALSTSSHRPPHSTEQSAHSLPTSEPALPADQVGRVQHASSPWEPEQFNLPFSVQAEEISDEEWRQMMTDDLRRHGVLGQIVDTVPPYIVNVDYAEHACVHMGNQLVPRQTQMQPHQINFPTNGSGGLFTLMAIDPDVPSQNNSIYSEFLHWLVVNIPDEDIERGDVLAEYLGPLPSHKGGQHRFIFLAHKQPNGSIINTAALPHAESCDWAARARFSARKFAKIHRLGEPMAINYFTTEFDSSVPLAIEQCLLRRQSLIHIQQRLS
ncbi:OV-16 antigen-like [Daphnia carinata]|uniref:OV-16 antigen-like n=1 Tax=Daphnia carinata TaxID=120202 RepID=UPI0025809EB5|nr:OV-16 antigen-like [Daphnia carinata]